MAYTENSYSENINPLSDLIPDEVFSILDSRGLINRRSVRDYQIKKKFRELRRSNMKSAEAIAKLHLDYPYLQFDSIKRIIYKR